jgi:hypothetical protein
MSSFVGIIPLYNHALTVTEVLAGLHAQGLHAIVVDDGSTDNGLQVAADWLNANAASGEVIQLGKNQGKAAALLAGFAAADRHGATHALTIDADGQHDCACIPAFLHAVPAGGANQTVVLGDRRALPSNYPTARLFGRFLSGLAVRAACGAIVGDAACGMRVYPVTLTRTLRCQSGRYAWEEEALIRLVWAGAQVQQVAIPVIYRPAAIAPSHYQFRRDWTEGTVILLWCVVLRIFSSGRDWAQVGSRRIDLLWPLGQRDRMAGCLMTMMAACQVAVTGMAVGLLTAASAPPSAIAAALALNVWISFRTNAPLLMAAIGWVAASMAPVATLISAPILGALWMFTTVHGLRRSR